MGLSVYYAVIRLLKFVLIPMVTVVILYRKRKQKLIGSLDFLMYFVLAMVGNVVGTRLGVSLIGKLCSSLVGIELPYNKCYVLVGMILAVFVIPKLLELFSLFSSKLFHMSDREMVKNTLDYYFLFVISIVCFGTQIGLTTFYFNLPYEVYKNLYIVSCLAAAFKVVMLLTDKDSAGSISDIHKSITDDRSREARGLTSKRQKVIDLIMETSFRNKNLLLSIPVALVFYLAFPSEHYLYQQFLAPLIIGCVGIKIRKIFCAAFIPSALVIIVMMLASLSGAINSMASSGRNIRSYWGHISPTDFGTAVLMIVCFIWVYFKDLPDMAFLLPAAFSLFISFEVTRCNTSGYITLLLMMIFLFNVFEKEIIEKSGRFKWLQKTVDTALLMVFPVLGMVILLMVYAYYKKMSFAGSLNTILHNRLFPASDMFAEHGLKPFGTYFDMNGYGGSTIHRAQAYTFVDSSYPQILIRYGFVTYALANILWIYTTLKAIKTGNRRVAYVMALLAVDFFMEHHWYELSYNVFVLLPFADFSEEKEGKVFGLVTFEKEFKERWREKKYAITFSLTCLFQLVLGFLLLPTAFSWLRTIFNGYGLYGGGRNGIVVFIVLTAILLATLVIIWNLSSLAAVWISDKKLSRRNVVFLVIAIAICIASMIKGDILIRSIVNDNMERVEGEREILELIASEASGKVYAEKLPEIYIRNIKGISKSYFSGEDFARYDDATVITDAVWDSQCLIGRGFLYLPISDEDAIFTNDEKVIEALQNAGYKLKGYNTYEYHVDLESMAALNGLPFTEDGGIRVQGTEHRLIYGPYVELYYGKYSANYRIKLSDTTLPQDAKICTLRVSSYYGEKILALVDIYRRDFDEEGNLEYDVPFSGGGHGYEFLVFTEEGIDLEVKSIFYRRTPDYDTHNRIDDEGRTIRTEYYDLDGNPYEISKGYYGVEYAYDDRDLAVMQRYLGSDFKPVLISSGYSEVHRVYNVKKQVTKESYYGIDSEPIELPDGYHSVEMEYDFSGNRISESYYDLEGNPVMANDAYFKYIRIFNEDNRWIRTEYYDTEGNPAIQKGNYAAIERDYDADGNVIEERYYGAQNEPVLYSDRYHIDRKEYNEKNQCIKELYYGTEGEPIIQSGGYYGYERSYDEAGNVIRNMYLGADEKPVITDWGYACWHRSFNSKNQIIREEYYNTDEKRILLGSGISAVEYERDSKGNAVSEKYFGVEDEAVLNTSNIAEVKREFNDLNQKISEEYFDLDGKRTLSTSGISRREYDYDSSGNCIMDCFYGVDNERVLVSGYWKVIRTYNENRKNVHEEYFGTDGNPVLISEKYAMVDFGYDENGKLIRKTFRDMDGNVVEEQIVE